MKQIIKYLLGLESSQGRMRLEYALLPQCVLLQKATRWQPLRTVPVAADMIFNSNVEAEPAVLMHTARHRLS